MATVLILWGYPLIMALTGSGLQAGKNVAFLLSGLVCLLPLYVSARIATHTPSHPSGNSSSHQCDNSNENSNDPAPESLSKNSIVKPISSHKKITDCLPSSNTEPAKQLSRSNSNDGTTESKSTVKGKRSSSEDSVVINIPIKTTEQHIVQVESNDETPQKSF